MKAKTDDDLNVQELTEAEIEIYQFPDCDSDEDDDFKEQNEKLKHSLPFALVGQHKSYMFLPAKFDRWGQARFLILEGGKCEADR